MIAKVLVRGAGLIVSPYYDDFPQLEAEALAPSAEGTIKSIFRVLGFRLSEAPAKDKPFAEVFTPLGVVLDMSEAPKGRIKLYGKPSRVQAVVSTVEETLTKEAMSGHEASSLAGRLRYLREGHFGGCSAVALRALSRRIAAGRRLNA